MKSLKELSDQSKIHFEAREWQLATNCLLEARERFPQEPAEGELARRLVQHDDGSIAIEVDLPPRLAGGNIATERKPVE